DRSGIRLHGIRDNWPVADQGCGDGPPARDGRGAQAQAGPEPPADRPAVQSGPHDGSLRVAKARRGKLPLGRCDMTDLAKLFKWMRGGDSGASSQAIAMHMVSGWCDGATPSDPAD